VTRAEDARREVRQAVDERAQGGIVECGGSVDGREPHPGRLAAGLLVAAEADPHAQQRDIGPGLIPYVAASHPQALTWTVVLRKILSAFRPHGGEQWGTLVRIP